LREVGFDGYVTLERESGEDRLRDMQIGLALLKRYV